MAFDLANAQTEARARVQDQSATNPHLDSSADLTPAIRSALARYSHDAPQQVISEFAGNGGQYYGLLASLTLFKEGFSSILGINYPAAVIATNDTPVVLDPKLDWMILPVNVATVRTLELYLPNHKPTASELVRIAYTAMHTLKDLDAAAATSVFTGDESAFYDLCGAKAADQIAAFLAQKGEPTIAADVTNHSDAAYRMQKVADRLMGEYFRKMGFNDKGVAPVSGWMNWDVTESSGWDQLFHPRRFR